MTDRVRRKDIDKSVIKSISDDVIFKLKHYIDEKLSAHTIQMYNKYNEILSIEENIGHKIDSINKEFVEYKIGVQNVYDKFKEIESKFEVILNLITCNITY